MKWKIGFFILLISLISLSTLYYFKLKNTNSVPSLQLIDAGYSEFGPRILKGKIIDMSCYLNHDSSGENHQQCARDCAKKGLPFGILAEDNYLYQIIPTGHDEVKTVNERLLDYLEENVVIEGSVSVKNGARVITLNKIQKS